MKTFRLLAAAALLGGSFSYANAFDPTGAFLQGEAAAGGAIMRQSNGMIPQMPTQVPTVRQPIAPPMQQNYNSNNFQHQQSYQPPNIVPQQRYVAPNAPPAGYTQGTVCNGNICSLAPIRQQPQAQYVPPVQTYTPPQNTFRAPPPPAPVRRR